MQKGQSKSKVNSDNIAESIAKLSLTDLIKRCLPEDGRKVHEAPDPTTPTKIRSISIDHDGSWLSPGAKIEFTYDKERQYTPPFQPLFLATIRDGMDSRVLREFGYNGDEGKRIWSHIATVLGPSRLLSLP